MSEVLSFTIRLGLAHGVLEVYSIQNNIITRTWLKFGNGRHIVVSKHKWVHGSTPLLRDEITLEYATTLRVNHLINPITKHWNTTLLHNLFVPYSAMEILCMETPHLDSSPDIPYWPHSKPEKYTMKSGYFILS